jgi:polyhydroxybutyrate depolymerase
MLAFIFLIAMTQTTKPLAPGQHHRTLAVEDVQRDYFVYVPTTKVAQPKAGWPLVLVFHGGGSNAEQMIEFCEMNATADKHGFVVVYPNGSGRVAGIKTFNGGNCCGYARRRKIDDVKFTRAVVDDVRTVVSIDARRVYATGMSNGAVMCYRLASEAADLVAAIAPIAGPMGTEKCSPSRPVSICHFHGTDDEFARYAGGSGKRSVTRTDFYSVEFSLNCWIKANGCSTEARVTKLPQKVDDGTQVTRYEYGGGRSGSEVVHYRIEGGGHTWPGHEPRFDYLGKSTGNIDANEAMWEFFAKRGRG